MYKSLKKVIFKQKSKIWYFLLVWLLIVSIFHNVKPFPEGINYQSKEYIIPAKDIKFLSDLTFKNAQGKIVYDQDIFDTVFSLIENARHYILIDMFLFNSHTGKSLRSYRNLTSELTSILLRKKKNIPSIKIDFITDPINTVYGGEKSKELELLKDAGINVIITDLTKLRDSNPLYSCIWRTFIQWIGNSHTGGRLKHPFSGNEQKVTVRSYLTLFNFKANHRKLFVADNNGEMKTIITSANCHDGSSAHSNIAVKIDGEFWKDPYHSEYSIASISGGKLQEVLINTSNNDNQEDKDHVKIQLLTENRIKKSLVSLLDGVGSGDRISIATFYLSDRKIIRSLIQAAENGADIRIILDPNKDAFGHKKIGIPNRQVAYELTKKSHGTIKIRWYDTHGEQFHSKLTIIEKRNGESSVLLGSANLTRRNLNNYNLEMNVLFTAGSSSTVMDDVTNYFEVLWNNRDGKHCTVDYDYYKESSALKTLLYRFQEHTGFSSF